MQATARRPGTTLPFILGLFVFIAPLCAGAIADLVNGDWQHAAPRDEISPQFAFEPKGGRSGGPCLVISSDDREGLSGSWFTTVPVQGGQHYRFTAFRKSEGITTPRRSTVSRILWQDAAGKSVPSD